MDVKKVIRLKHSILKFNKTQKCNNIDLIQEEKGKGSLYIGNYLAALDINQLRKYKINAVLTVAKCCPLNYGISTIEHLKLEVDDHEDENIIGYFE